MPKMNLLSAQHPVRDTRGRLYEDLDFVVEKESHVIPSTDGLFHYHVHSKTKKDIPHVYLTGKSGHDRNHHHQISVIHKKHAESGMHFNTDFSILAYPDARFVTSLRAVSKHLGKKHTAHFFDFVRDIIIETQPRLISGTLHTVLSYKKDGHGAIPTFEINEDGYQIDKDYDDTLSFQLDSKKEIIGCDPYYISDLDKVPTSRKPARIETSIAKIDLFGKKVGIFVGLEIRGTFQQIASAFRSTDLGKKIKEDDNQFPQWPNIVHPFLSIHMLKS